MTRFFAEYRDHIAAILLAAIAGLLGCITRAIKCKRRIRWVQVLVEAASSGFIGFLMLHLCQALRLSEAWTGVVVGLFGWVGASSSIALVERIVFRRLGVLDDVAAASSNTDNNDATKAQ